MFRNQQYKIMALVAFEAQKHFKLLKFTFKLALLLKQKLFFKMIINLCLLLAIKSSHETDYSYKTVV